MTATALPDALPKLPAIPDTNEFTSDGARLLKQSQELEVTTREQADEAGRTLKYAKERIAAIETAFEPLCEATNRAHKMATGMRGTLVKPFEQARQYINAAIAAFDRKEQKRLRDEQAAREAAARKEAEEAQLARAMQLEKAGKKEQAAAVIEAPTQFIAPAKEEYKPATVNKRVTWGDYEVTDPAAIPREYLMPDDKAIRKVIQGLKENTNIPGIRPVPRETFY